MKVIPVIDILGGIAVHAVRGRRSEYQPLKSILCPSAAPLDVASAFKALGFSELYIADLDAIAGGRPNLSALRQITDTTGLRLMVDAGTADIERAQELLQSHVSKIIIGTETLPSLRFVREALLALGKGRVVVSLDLKGDKVLGGFGLGKLDNPLNVLLEIQKIGAEQIIVLDLARVGTSEGVNMSLLREALKNRKGKILVGGGVRSIGDLVKLRNMGVFGVLVATALHSGKIRLEDLKQSGLLS